MGLGPKKQKYSAISARNSGRNSGVKPQIIPSTENSCYRCRHGTPGRCQLYLEGNNGLASFPEETLKKAAKEMKFLFDKAQENNKWKGTVVVSTTLIHCDGNVSLVVTNYDGPNLGNIYSVPRTHGIKCYNIRDAVKILLQGGAMGSHNRMLTC